MEPDETDVDPTDADETDVDEEPAQPIAPRRRSTGGQMLGAALLGLGEIYNGPKKDQHVIEVDPVVAQRAELAIRRMVEIT